jgi:hypothetical protein
LNKALLYSIFSVIVGLAMVLTPPLVFSRLTNSDHDVARSFFQSFREIEGTRSHESLDQSRVSQREVEALAASFAVVLGAFLAFKRKTLRRGNRTFSPYPY